ncbi:MAG: amidohydrolase family protein [Acidobacteriota bacterium]
MTSKVRMSWRGLLLACVFVAACSGPQGAGQAKVPPGSVRLFEGARLIVGDGSAPIENGALLVEDGRITHVGRAGDRAAPTGATRVDVTGKTVMPALVSTHIHVGLLKGTSFTTDNYTREVLVDHLERYAFHGVGTVLSAGTDMGPLSFQIRDERPPGAAWLLTSGRGMAAPNAGPGFASIAHTSYPITSADDGIKAVQELAASRANAVKIWVDDRGGRVKKLTPDIYTPIVTEAHKHGMLVVAHVFYLKDAHELVEAGVNGLIHLVRDEVMDDALIARMKERRVFAAPNIGGTHRRTLAEPPPGVTELLAQSQPPDVVDAFRRSITDLTPQAREATRATYEKMQRSLVKLKAAGVTLVLGGDTGIPGAFHGWADLYELEQMVESGMTPAEVIVAATSAPARVLGLDDVGVLAPGKRADLVVLDANPLDDITNARRISAVYLRGLAVDRDALRARWVKAGSSRQ